MTAHALLQASWGCGRAVKMCSACRAGVLRWLASVQRTAGWFLGKLPFLRRCLFAVLLGLPCVRWALTSYCLGVHSFIPAGHRVLHRELMCWPLVDTEASSVVGPRWAQMLVGYHPHPAIAIASGLWITKGRFPHLVSDCHWGWSVPFLQCKEQSHPVRERLPSENRATCHAGYLPLPFTLRSFYFFSINKVQEGIMQSCIKLVRLELEITQQTQQWRFGWDLNVHSFIHSFVFIHIFIPNYSFITGMFTQMFSGWKESESESEVTQSCPTLCNPMDCSLPGSSIHGILQAKVLEWVAISFSRGSSRPRDRTQVSRIPSRCFNLWAQRSIIFVVWSKEFTIYPGSLCTYRIY